MPLRPLALRVLCLLGLSVWMGGFTFYSAVVIPVLHESLGSLDTGFVTQQVTDYLNYIGVAAVVIWWVVAGVERREGPARVRAVRLLLLSASTIILVGLIVLHRVMDGRLETGGLRGFYPLHRVYLVASTVQWFLNLGLMVTLLVPPRLQEENIKNCSANDRLKNERILLANSPNPSGASTSRATSRVGTLR